MMKLGADLNVFVYDIEIKPEIINDTYLSYQILRMCRKRLEMMLGIYVTSGRNLFTMTDINESFKFNVEYKQI